MASSYGIVYRPELGGHRSPSIPDLKYEGIQFIRITWTDYINSTRFRILPIAYFEKLLAAARPGVSVTKCCLGIVGLSLVSGFNATGEYLYAVDIESLRRCPYAPGHASVYGWFQEKTPSPTSTSLSVDLCPRTLLGNLVKEARQIETSFLVGIETEFILLKSTEPIEAIDTHDWSTSSALYTGSVASIVLEEIATALIGGGVELQLYHAEAAPGQYEVVTGPLSPLEAADALVFTRETIANIANKHKLRATFAPRVFSNTTGSAAHTHVSIHHSRTYGSESPLAPTLKSYEASFLQSLLDNLPAICALTLPTAASYDRMVDGVWSGGTYVCWGTDNREAPVRLTGPSHSHNFELKCVDGTSNPYLALAGIVAAGIDGVRNKRQLEVGDCVEMAASLDVEGRNKLNIGEKRMPLKIEEARDQLQKSATMKRYLGEHFVNTYLAVNETLQRHLSADNPELERKKVVELY